MEELDGKETHNATVTGRLEVEIGEVPVVSAEEEPEQVAGLQLKVVEQ